MEGLQRLSKDFDPAVRVLPDRIDGCRVLPFDGAMHRSDLGVLTAFAVAACVSSPALPPDAPPTVDPRGQPQPTIMPASEQSPSTQIQQQADVAAPPVERPWMSLAEWRHRHERQLRALHRPRAELLFVGDSITEAWCESAPFERAFGRHVPLNLGIGGDQTQHLLWRIEQGSLDGTSARLVVVLIGVNNLGDGFSAQQTLAGIQAVVAGVIQRLPSVPVLLLSILPAGSSRDDELRRAIVDTNALLRKWTSPPGVSIRDVGPVLLEPDGSISPAIMADFLHPTPLGQERLTAAVRPLVEQMLQQR